MLIAADCNRVVSIRMCPEWAGEQYSPALLVTLYSLWQIREPGAGANVNVFIPRIRILQNKESLCQDQTTYG